MTPYYLLDTNIISEPLRPTPHPKVLQRLQYHQSELAVAAIVWHELWFGCLRLPLSNKRTTLETYLRQVVAPTVPLLPYDEPAAVWHAAERARLINLGRTPSFVDGQIAAVAATQRLVLVTFNFADYADFQGLQIEDWRS